jgi:chromosome segregation ATPase
MDEYLDLIARFREVTLTMAELDKVKAAHSAAEEELAVTRQAIAKAQDELEKFQVGPTHNEYLRISEIEEKIFLKKRVLAEIPGDIAKAQKQLAAINAATEVVLQRHSETAEAIEDVRKKIYEQT